MDLLKDFISISEDLGVSSASVVFDLDVRPNPEVLSPKELDIYSRFTSPKRKYEFIAGKIACKKAFFKSISGEKDSFEKFPFVSVLNEESGAPFVENSDLFVSVSHSHEIAIASVSNHKVGVDIEQINPKRISALKRMSAEYPSEDICDLTALWTLKESLGKALRTGIIENFSLYDTQNLRYENGVYHCDFKNFPSSTFLAAGAGFS